MTRSMKMCTGLGANLVLVVLTGCAYETGDEAALDRALGEPLDSQVRERSDAIYFGAEVATGVTRYRSVAHLEFSKNGYDWECGGTLVGSDWVATAAHCFYAPAEAKLPPYNLTDAHFRDKLNWKVTFNRYDETGAGGELRSFKSSPTIHTSFKNVPVADPQRPFQGWDIAVVQLNSASSYKPLRLVGDAQMTGVDTGGITSPDAGLGARVTAMGWGLTEAGETTKLHDVTLGLTGVGSNCYDPPGFLDASVTSNEICVWWYLGLGNVNLGDSGGPILLSIGGVDQVVGVTSWGYVAAGAPLSPGVVTRAGTVADWVETTISGNYYLSSGASGGWSVLNSTTLSRSRFLVGDFDANGRDDLLYTHDGTKWAVRYGGTGNWTDIADDAAEVGSMLVGNFDSNSKSDVLITTGAGWYLRSGGTGARSQTSTSAIGASKLLVGDFNGDGKSDILYADGSSWRIQYAATGGWVTVRNETWAKSSLLVADVDGNGRDDVIITDGTNWKVSSSATGAPTNLTTSGTLAPNLVVGDFNNDGRDDVLYADGSSFRVKYSGTGNWVRLQYSGGKANFMLAGRFDATAGTDILQMTR